MKKVKVLFRKELLDVLRDKKTLVMMVLMFAAMAGMCRRYS